MSDSTKRRIGNAVVIAFVAGWLALILHLHYLRVSAIPIDADKPAHAKLSKGEYRGPRPWDIERAIDGNVKNSGIEPYFIAR
jgi:hypothetical protein